MSISCDVILLWNATPAQLKALGAALWRCCTHTAGDSGIYQYLDNQALADLIAGKLPLSSQGDRRGVHFRFRDATSGDRQAALESLRHEIPANGVEDIMVEGTSWGLDESKSQSCAPEKDIRFAKAARDSSAGVPVFPERRHDSP